MLYFIPSQPQPGRTGGMEMNAPLAVSEYDKFLARTRSETDAEVARFKAIAPILRKAAEELTATMNRLEDSESVRNFLRDWFDALPDALHFSSYGDDRIRKSPQYRALSPKARVAADWAFAPAHCTSEREPMLPGHGYIETQYLAEARDFFSRVVTCCRDDDEADEIAQNAHANLRGVIHDREIELAYA